MTPDPASLLVLAPLRVEAFALRRGAPRLHVVRTGMGPLRAQRAARIWRSAPEASLVIAGLCGALDPALRPGDVIVPSQLRSPEGTQGAPDAAALRHALCRRGLRVHDGTLQGVERTISGRERQSLREGGAHAVDMESPWLAAAAAGRPFAVLRVVLDAPGAELLRLSLLRRLWLALSHLRAAAAVLAEWAGQAAPRSLRS
jgi:4-hydroxy-3-methylbut-2-enyl diphosphate reductase